MSESTHYEILDVSFKATTEEIKQAYRRLAKLFHPDNKSKTADSEKIILVNAAYEVLGDPQRRRSYDQQLRYGQFQPEILSAAAPTTNSYATVNFNQNTAIDSSEPHRLNTTTDVIDTPPNMPMHI